MYIHVYNIYIYIYYIYKMGGSLEIKLPTTRTDGKAKVGRVREEKRRRKKIREEKEAEERRCTMFLPMFWGSSGSKSRIAKAAGAEPSGEIRREQLHAVVARSKFQSQNVKKHLMFGALFEVEM